MIPESTLRRAACNKGFRLTKARGQQHSNNHGLWRLVDDRNVVVLGVNFDASDQAVAHFLGLEV